MTDGIPGDEIESREDAQRPVERLVSTDGTGLLCRALYGREPTAKDYIGGSEAKMLYDAAKVVEAARKIQHWHDADRIGGMVVSADSVRELWAALPDEC